MAAVITGSLMGFTDAPEFLVYTIEVIKIYFCYFNLVKLPILLFRSIIPFAYPGSWGGFIYFIYILLKPLAKVIQKVLLVWSECYQKF